jgi:hypothetical protein
VFLLFASAAGALAAVVELTLPLPATAEIENGYDEGDTLKIVGDSAMSTTDWSRLKALKTKEYALVVNDATTTTPTMMGLMGSKITSFTAKNVTSINMMMFSGCASLANVELPEAASLGNMAFSTCASLTNVDAPKVVTVGIGAFGNCTSLTSISLPAAENIKGTAFSDCASLTGVSLPVAEVIGDGAFAGCTSLESITLPSAKTIGKLAFGKVEEVDEHTEEVILSQTCPNLVTVSLPMAESIGEKAFGDCEKLAAVSLPSVKTIGKNAFINDKSLTTLVLPDNAPALEADAFSGVATANINMYVPGAPSGYDAGNWPAAGLTPITIPALSIVTPSLPAGTEGALYSQALEADSALPIVWSIESGSLPEGLALAAAGTISGVPARAGTSGFTLKASFSFAVDASNGSEVTKEFSITIKESSTPPETGDGEEPGEKEQEEPEDPITPVQPDPEEPPAEEPETPVSFEIDDGDGEEPPAVIVSLDPEKDITVDPDTGVETVAVPEGTLTREIIEAAIEATGGTASDSVVEIRIGKPVDMDTGEPAEVRAIHVEIHVSDLITVRDSDVENVKIATPVGEVTLNTDALKDLITGVEDRDASTVEIVIAKDDENLLEELTTEQKETLHGDEKIRAVFDVSLSVGGSKLPGFETSGKLTVGLSYVLADGEDADGVKVDYIREEGGAARMTDSRYSDKKQLAIFETGHLSVYAVVYEPKADNTQNPPSEEGSSGGGCSAGLGSAGSMILLALGTALAAKRGKPASR